MNKEPEGFCTNNPEELKINRIKTMHKNNQFKMDIIHIPHYTPSNYFLYE